MEQMADAIQPRRLPLTAQTTHSDLLARLQEDEVPEPGGTPVCRERGGRKYWYLVQRLADHTAERYPGPDTDDVRTRVERARKIQKGLSQRGKLARMCLEGGMPWMDAQTGKVLLALWSYPRLKFRPPESP